MAPPPLRPPPVSLAGEILDATPDVACWPATQAWLGRADANGDGRLQPAEVKADDARFFASIDANGDHVLTSTELTAYRDKVAPNAYRDRRAAPTRPSAADSPMQEEPPAGTPAGLRPPPRDSGIRAQPDPVMAADTNLDFRVTPEELDTRAKERFDRLDTNGDGNLDSTELAAYCPPE